MNDSSYKYIVSTSPHITNGRTTRGVMFDVIVALMPAVASITKIRAVIAGFAKFLPRPPKSIFTTSVAKIPPIIGT